MTIYYKGEAWPEQTYREPTVEEKAARHAQLQARCPYDLDEVGEWTNEMRIDWGYRLMSDFPEDPSNTEHAAFLAACDNLKAVQRWCREFIDYAKRRALQNGYTANETAN